MKKLLVVVLCLGLMGCVTAENLLMGSDHTKYKNRTQEIEQAYQNDEITKAEYLDLKLKNEQVYQESSTQNE